MGRGYSATREGSTRNPRKTLRTRSVSLAQLNRTLSAAAEGRHLNEETDSLGPPEEEFSIKDPGVLSKFKTCGQITDAVLNEVCELCVPGANTFDLCQKGNESMLAKCRKVFRHAKDDDGNKIHRGICFPTNVSINNVLCNHCPQTLEEGKVIQEGDVVKVHLGCHVDGFPTQAAKTIVVGQGNLTSQKNAAAILAAEATANVMTHMLRPGTENGTITDAIAHMAHHFGVEAVEGVLSNRTKRWIIDGSEAIIGRRVIKTLPQQDVAEVEIGDFQVWTLDVAFTTSSEYKMYLNDDNLNIWRRNEIEDQVRLRAAETLLHECRSQLFCFPFTPNMTEKPLKTKLGIKALREKQLVDSFPSLRSKPSTITTRCCLTVAVTDKRIHVLCGEPSQVAIFEGICGLTTPKSMAEILATPLAFGTKKTLKKAAEAAGADEEAEEPAEEENDGTKPKAKKRRRMN